MNNKDLITILVSVFTFCIGGILVYWRENRKLFQEKIFEYKFNAYKEIVEEIGMYYQDVFSFLEFFQNYEGEKEKWFEEAKDYFNEYYKKAFGLEKLYYKNLILLPDEQLDRLRELTGGCISHITHHYHIGTSIPHGSYDKIFELLMEFAEEARKDISINIINSSLNKRLVEQFYPIKLPRTRLENFSYRDSE